MRVRKKKNGEARFAACADVLIQYNKETPALIDIDALFSRRAKHRIEIGCGKGTFITELARRDPDTDFIAVEMVRDVLIFAMEKVRAAGLTNVRFLCADAVLLDKLFAPASFDRIYINFCDPWPKARHAKRRLTYHIFLSSFAPLLTDGGMIEFKTDNSDLFEFSLPEFESAGYVLSCLTRDLHASEYADGNIQTEYERNFSEKGFKINRVCAQYIGVKKSDGTI